jgi:hypothetical protein
MFFSEKSHSPRPDFKSCVSSVANAANVQHVPHGAWSFTGVIHPCSRESQADGISVYRSRRAAVPLFADRTDLAFGGGRYPHNGESSPAAHAASIATHKAMAMSPLDAPRRIAGGQCRHLLHGHQVEIVSFLHLSSSPAQGPWALNKDILPNFPLAITGQKRWARTRAKAIWRTRHY